MGFNLCTLAGQSPQELLETADAMVASFRTNRLVKAAVHGFSAATPQLELKLDRRKAEMLGLTPKVIFQTLQERFKSITFTPSDDPLIIEEMKKIEEYTKNKNKV